MSSKNFHVNPWNKKQFSEGYVFFLDTKGKAIMSCDYFAIKRAKSIVKQLENAWKNLSEGLFFTFFNSILVGSNRFGDGLDSHAPWTISIRVPDLQLEGQVYLAINDQWRSSNFLTGTTQ